MGILEKNLILDYSFFLVLGENITNYMEPIVKRMQ